MSSRFSICVFSRIRMSHETWEFVDLSLDRCVVAGIGISWCGARRGRRFAALVEFLT